MSLKKQLIKAFNMSESDFDNSNSDLFVLYSEKVMKWLKANYEFFKNVTISYSNVKGQSWYRRRFIEIPFSYEEFF